MGGRISGGDIFNARISTKRRDIEMMVDRGAGVR